MTFLWNILTNSFTFYPIVVLRGDLVNKASLLWRFRSSFWETWQTWTTDLEAIQIQTERPKLSEHSYSIRFIVAVVPRPLFTRMRKLLLGMNKLARDLVIITA